MSHNSCYNLSGKFIYKCSNYYWIEGVIIIWQVLEIKILVSIITTIVIKSYNTRIIIYSTLYIKQSFTKLSLAQGSSMEHPVRI